MQSDVFSLKKKVSQSDAKLILIDFVDTYFSIEILINYANKFIRLPLLKVWLNYNKVLNWDYLCTPISGLKFHYSTETSQMSGWSFNLVYIMKII